MFKFILGIVSIGLVLMGCYVALHGIKSNSLKGFINYNNININGKDIKKGEVKEEGTNNKITYNKSKHNER